jgi:regulator of sigma E protease
LSFLNLSNLAILPRFAIVLGIMVVVHELGHFIAAKLCGVRVETFAIGFGKRLFGFVHNGTDYCVNLIPLGGYVKMTNEMPEPGSGKEHVPTDDPGDFQNHPRWQRTLIAVAGPVANFILAFVLMAGLYMFDNQVPAYMTQPAVADFVAPNSPFGHTGIQSGDRIVHFDNVENPTWEDLLRRGPIDSNQEAEFAYIHNGKRVDTKVFVENKDKPEDLEFSKLGIVPVEQAKPIEVQDVSASNTPAALAGFRPKDVVEAIDGQHFHSVDALLAYLQDRGGKPSVVTLVRQDATGKSAELAVPIQPFYGDGQRGKMWMMGFKVVPPPTTVQQLPFAAAVEASWTDNLKNSKLIFDVLHRLFTRQVSVKSLSSPVGMAVQVNEAFEAPGSFPIIATMAMISLNLGIFNLLPIPILDGGMILFLAIESLMRRDMNQAVKERVYQVAFVCLVLFAAVVIFNDITKLLPAHVKM